MRMRCKKSFGLTRSCTIPVLAALKALVALQKASDSAPREDVDDLNDEQKDKFRAEAKHIIEEMIGILDAVEDQIGYPHWG